MLFRRPGRARGRTSDADSASKGRSLFAALTARLEPTQYVRHDLHSPERIWTEKNCYVDIWIELVHALGFEPNAMLAFTVAVDFEGDQWTFFKPPHDELRDLYATFFRGFGALPIPLPGTAFSRAKQVLGRLLAIHRANVDDHLATPRDDGLSRILAAKSPLDGAAPASADVARELHHLLIAGLIVRRWLATMVIELDRQPELRARLADEIARALPDGDAPLTLERLAQMPYLTQVTHEVRRISPVVHVFFGKARETIEFAGHTIPAGWAIFWGIRSSHLTPAVYPDPLRFDPERFAGARAEQLRQTHAFAPNGAGGPMGHKCAGFELAPLILQVFTVELLRRHAWTLAAPQNLEPTWNQVPPMPRDGLRATVTLAPANRASGAR